MLQKIYAMMEYLQNLFGFSRLELIIHVAIFVVNIALFFFSKPIVSSLQSSSNGLQGKVRILQFLNILVLVLHVIDLLFLTINIRYDHYFINIGATLVVLYIALYLYSVFSYFSRRRFGAQKEIDEKTVYFDTYSSRLINLIILAAMVIIGVYALIKLWGADSLLETTGIFGIFIAFLAFTSSVWAPDIISGLIILNSQLLEDGDIVMISGSKDEYIISKVSLVYVILYDVRNNHRTLIKNSQFLQSKIENLSRVASLDGIRQQLKYKIGYPKIEHEDREQRVVALDNFFHRVGRVFTSVNEQARADELIKINEKRDFEWSLTQTGDNALEFSLWVYLARIPNTKSTQMIRSHLIGSLLKINHLVLREAVAEKIDLSTPDLISLSLHKDSDYLPQSAGLIDTGDAHHQ